MFEVISLNEYAVFVLIAVFAGFVHGSIGLGFPLLSTAMLSTFIDLRIAILITLIPTVTVNLFSIAKGGNWRESLGQFWPLAAWCLVGSVIGAWVIVYTDPTPYKLLLALLIFLYLVADRSSRRLLSKALQFPRVSQFGFGMAAGFSAGSTNTMVPILVIYSLESGWAKTVMVQVFNMCFFSGKAAQLAVFGTSGTFTLQIFLTTLPIAGIAAGSLYLGQLLQDRIDIHLFRRIIKLVLLILGIILTAQVLLSLFGA